MGQTVNKGVQVAIKKVSDKAQVAIETTPMDTKHPPGTSETEPLVDSLLRDYLPILVLLAVAVGLGLVLILAAALIAVRNPDPEKLSAYECGFNAFDDARMKFDVRFYL
eukprot:gene1922-2528_t